MEGIAMVSQRNTQSGSRISSMMEGAVQRPKQAVEEYPISSMLVVFGVGLGVGVVLSQALCAPLMRAFEPEPSFTEKLGRSMYDAMASMMPESVTRRMSA
jgi:hypothetical protein